MTPRSCCIDTAAFRKNRRAERCLRQHIGTFGWRDDDHVDADPGTNCDQEIVAALRSRKIGITNDQNVEVARRTDAIFRIRAEDDDLSNIGRTTRDANEFFNRFLDDRAPPSGANREPLHIRPILIAIRSCL